VPLVIQFNKRDLPNIRTDAEIGDLARRGKEPVFKASAVNGQGVLESFFGLLDRTWKHLDLEHDLKDKLGLKPDAFLAMAAASLGHAGQASALSSAFIGGTPASGGTPGGTAP
jgi:hypothetical protein